MMASKRSLLATVQYFKVVINEDSSDLPNLDFTSGRAKWGFIGKIVTCLW